MRPPLDEMAGWDPFRGDRRAEMEAIRKQRIREWRIVIGISGLWCALLIVGIVALLRWSFGHGC